MAFLLFDGDHIPTLSLFAWWCGYTGQLGPQLSHMRQLRRPSVMTFITTHPDTPSQTPFSRLWVSIAVEYRSFNDLISEVSSLTEAPHNRNAVWRCWYLEGFVQEVLKAAKVNIWGLKCSLRSGLLLNLFPQLPPLGKAKARVLVTLYPAAV
ncbi:hypothetical protein BJX64DRAFT_253860 [Aspergillus heterothallicus]